MELEESTYLTSGSTTKPQLSRQYGTGTKTEIYSRVAPGKSGLHVRGEEERIIALELW